jgi:membrane protein YqaA with SNARE-associated domain
MAYLALFTSAFLSATILPFASEVGLAAVVRLNRVVVFPVLIATAGNYLGACTTYLLGNAAARAIDRTRARRRRSESIALHLIRRFGAPALLLSWLPLVGDVIVGLAGAVRMPFGVFSIYTIIGKALRYAIVGWLTLKV